MTHSTTRIFLRNDLLKYEEDASRAQLGSIAVELGFISRADLEKILVEQKKLSVKEPLGQLLLKRKLISQLQLEKMLAIHMERQRKLISALQQERKTANQDLELAREIQSSMLKQRAFEDKRIAINCMYFPTKTLSGDFYEYITGEEGHYYVAIGDASGKGAPAALLMSLCIGMLRIAVASSQSAHDILCKLNDVLYQMKRSTFVTMCLMHFDFNSGKMTIASAGHNPPLITKHDGSISEIATEGTAAGIVKPQQFPSLLSEVVIPISEIDKIFAYTDGIIDARSASGEMFGNDRLLKTLQTGRTLKGADIKQLVATTLKQHVGEQQPEDDCTLICVDVR